MRTRHVFALVTGLDVSGSKHGMRKQQCASGRSEEEVHGSMLSDVHLQLSYSFLGFDHCCNHYNCRQYQNLVHT
jgi:hypothetical protein